MIEMARLSLDIPVVDMAKLSKLSHIECKTKSYLLREAIHLLLRARGMDCEEMENPVRKVNRVKRPDPITRHVSYYMSMPLSDLMRGDK
jgi:predicted DNA-binding protein